LASKAIARPDILPDSDRVLRYNEIIHDENSRMKQQVDKILQMAVLEDGDYELNLVPLDVHGVIQKAVENIALQVERKGGKIRCKLEAESHMLSADAVHLANIIYNLLDNANKYSPEEPHIEVTTRNADGLLKISIHDEGIGMKEEDASRAFEKYFRVPTGNQHDVKGFGLGLSYVKLMVEAHNGEVSISSSPGKGTTVDLSFPMDAMRIQA
jgi:two-component system phosphate regulon sensor histidine kinase PhoR